MVWGCFFLKAASTFWKTFCNFEKTISAMLKRVFISAVILMSICNVALAKPRVGVVLSGGGALGYAHIGALQALYEQGIEADCVAGSSMGALVGVMYAQGITPQEIHDIILKEKYNDRKRILHFSGRIKKSLGFATHANVRKTLQHYVADSFDSLPKKFFACVADITDSEERVISSGGHLIDYVLASSSIPGVFEAIEIDGHFYVDGGVLNNLPAREIRKECDVLIGIDVHPDKSHEPVIENVLDVAMATLHALMQNNSTEGRELCDYLVEPRANEQYKAFDFDNFEDIYRIGYEAMKAYLAEHPKLLALGK